MLFGAYAAKTRRVVPRKDHDMRAVERVCVRVSRCECVCRFVYLHLITCQHFLYVLHIHNNSLNIYPRGELQIKGCEVPVYVCTLLDISKSVRIP